MGLCRAEPRPTVGSFESGLVKAFGARRRQTAPPVVRSRPGVPLCTVERSFTSAIDDTPEDDALPIGDCAVVASRDVFDVDGACLEHRPREHVDLIQTSPRGALRDSSSSHRRSAADYYHSDRQEGRLCACGVQADAQSTPDARALPISLYNCRQVGRVVSLVALVAVWMVLSYLACVLASHVQRY